jgi:branched-chain amino acid transport system permease protein
MRNFSLRELWQRRRDLGGVWWRWLGKAGLSRERYHELPGWQQRLGKVVLGGVIAFLIVLVVKILEHYFGEGNHSILTFDWSAYLGFLIVALLVVPEWSAVPALPMRLVIPGATIVAGVTGLIVGLATSNTRNGVLSSVGLLIALIAPPWIASGRRRNIDTPLLEKRMPIGKKVVPLGALALAICFPFYAGHMFTIPVFGAFPDVTTAVNMLVFIMMAVGLNIVVGYAGLLDLGYVAFYAVGAYTAAWFASLQFAGAKCPKPGISAADCPVATVPNIDFSLGGIGVTPGSGGIHVTIWVLLLAAGLLTALIGVIIGRPTLRLRGDYLAIVTLGFGEIMPQVARNGNNLFNTGFNLTGGPQGITPVDSPGFGHRLSDWTGGFLPENYLSHPQSANVFYWTALLLLLITVFCSLRLRDSRLGRAWVAIREDEIAASAMGVPLMRTKTWSSACGAFFGGIAGAYYAAFKSSTFPQDFYFNISVFILCMVILGGMGNVWGVILGAAFLEYLNVEGLANTGAWLNTNLGMHIDVPGYQIGIYGVLIVIVMLLRPQGLLPSARRKRELELGTHDEPAYDAAHGAYVEPAH